MKKLTTLTLKETSEQTIANATDIFNWIDSDFKNWNLDKPDSETLSQAMDVYEMIQDATFAQIFTDPEKMYMTQGQIIEFCKSHRSELCQYWYTFFLIKQSSEYFVVCVYVRSDGDLGAGVYGFSDDDVWRAEFRPRFVLPQLTLENFESVTLSNSDSLTLESRIEKIETWIENVRNQLPDKISFDEKFPTKDEITKLYINQMQLGEKINQIIDFLSSSQCQENDTDPIADSKEITEELYRIVDSFLTEAKDQNGNDRNVERLNKDRHLAVEKLSNLIASTRQSAVEQEREKNNKEMADAIEFAKQGWIDQGKKEYKERAIEIAKKEKCAVPKNPLPKNLNDLETFTVQRIDDCLKYAGRFNYNKAIDDILSLLTKLT